MTDQCADCGHDRDSHHNGETWCHDTHTIGHGGGPCDCGEYIDPDDVEAT